MEILEVYSLSSNNLQGEASYFKGGQGPSIILLHGFAETYEIWNNIYPELLNTHTVIIPQIPACGNSTSFKNGFSMEQIADYILAILKQERIAEIILFGHSMGGYAAMAFAEKYPNRLAALSLVHSSAQADSKEKKRIRAVAIDFIRKNGKQAFLKTLLPKLYADFKSTQAFFEKHIEMANTYTEEQIIACYYAMMQRKDRTSVLFSLNCPIQFIGGKEDASVAYQDLEKQATYNTQIRLCLFNGIAHTSMHEQPDLLINTIFGFLDDILQTKYS